MTKNPSDEIYERCVAAFCAAEEFSADVLSVTRNAKIKGLLSCSTRQIDVMIEDMRYAPKASRIIIDAKRHKRKIDVKKVEEFEGMMRDCEARQGIIVCASGATKGAIRRAQDLITVTLLSYEDALEFEWMYEPCLGRCSRLKENAGMVLLSAMKVCGLGPGWLMYKTGKCDRCHQFHAWCSDCGNYLSVADGQIVKCDCDDREWGSIPESKISGHMGTPNSTWLMLNHDREFIALDRKPIGRVRQQAEGMTQASLGQARDERRPGLAC